MQGWQWPQRKTADSTEESAPHTGNLCQGQPTRSNPPFFPDLLFHKMVLPNTGGWRNAHSGRDGARAPKPGRGRITHVVAARLSDTALQSLVPSYGLEGPWSTRTAAPPSDRSVRRAMLERISPPARLTTTAKGRR